MPLLIEPNGNTAELPDADYFTLHQAIGGYVEAIPLVNGGFLVIDEDGEGKGLPLNILATLHLQKSGGPSNVNISGNAVLCEKGELQ